MRVELISLNSLNVTIIKDCFELSFEQQLLFEEVSLFQSLISNLEIMFQVEYFNNCIPFINSFMQKLSHPKLPLLVFTTRTGTIYNLTPSNQPHITGIQLSVGDFMHLKDVMENFPNGFTLKGFLGYSDNIITYLAPYDYYKQKCMSGCQGNKVKISGIKGYQDTKAYDYWQMADKIKPDILVGLTEMPCLQKNHKQESNKAYKRATSKTTAFLKQLQKANKPGVYLAPVHGGKQLGFLAKSIDDCFQFQIDGFVICDLCQGETLEQREAAYQLINNKIKAEGRQHNFALSLSGQGKIQDIAHAMKFGIQIFEVNYPFALAESQKALVNRNGIFIEHTPEAKLNLQPLDPNCKCKACQSYSESYICHLVKCFEMTGKVLLTIHNLQQYLTYFNV